MKTTYYITTNKASKKKFIEKLAFFGATPQITATGHNTCQLEVDLSKYEFLYMRLACKDVEADINESDSCNE